MTINSKTSTICLELIGRQHLPFLFDIRNSEDFIYNLTSRGVLNSIDNFEDELLKDFQIDRHKQFVIKYCDRYIGTIYSYSYNKLDKYSFISTYIVPEYQGKFFGAKAFILFALWLFDNYKLYKIYCDIYSYNTKSLKLFERVKHSNEGCFRNQKFLNGIRYDVIRIALYEKDIKIFKGRI